MLVSHARLSRDDLMPGGQCLISGYQVTCPYYLDTWNRLGWSFALARPQPCALANSTSGRPNLIEWYSPRQGTVDDLMSKCSAIVFSKNIGKCSASFGSIPQLFLETGLATRKWARFIRIFENHFLIFVWNEYYTPIPQRRKLIQTLALCPAHTRCKPSKSCL